MTSLDNGADGTMGTDVSESTSHIREKLDQYHRLEKQVWTVRLVVLLSLLIVVAAGGALGLRAYRSWNMDNIQNSLGALPEAVFREVNVEPYVTQIVSVYGQEAVRGVKGAWPKLRLENAQRVDKIQEDGTRALGTILGQVLGDELLRSVAARVAEANGVLAEPLEILLQEHSHRVKEIVQQAVLNAAKTKINRGVASYHSLLDLSEARPQSGEEADTSSSANEQPDILNKDHALKSQEQSAPPAKVSDAK